MIDAVLLDVGGVFVLPDHDRISAAIARGGVQVDRDRLDRAHYEGVSVLSEFNEGDREVWKTYNRAYARTAGVPDDAIDEVVEHLLNEFSTGGVWRRVVPGSVDALRALAALDVGLAIVSNADGNAEERLLEQRVCQIGQGPGVEVDTIIDSEVVGVAKPDPRIFEMALDRLGVPADRALHVGDTPAADVDGARAAGVRPVLVDPYDLHGHLEVERVPALADVVELVAKANA
ncbi:MAG: HAD-IA family hydrolase [Actinobacteria bacterium]|nr:HAD-IA family hydrolase [Actinomycetota bacterium]